MTTPTNKAIVEAARETIQAIAEAHVLAAREGAAEMRRCTEAAAEQLAMEAGVQRAAVRLEGHSAVLALIGTHRAAVETQLAALPDATGPMARALRHQLAALERQEEAVLASLGGTATPAGDAPPARVNDYTSRRRGKALANGAAGN